MYFCSCFFFFFFFRSRQGSKRRVCQRSLGAATVQNLDSNQSHHLEHLPVPEPPCTSLQGQNHCAERHIDVGLPDSEAAGELLKKHSIWSSSSSCYTKGTFTLHKLGNVSRETGDFQQARQYLEQSLKMMHALHDHKGHPGIAATLHMLGSASQQTGDFQ